MTQRSPLLSSGEPAPDPAAASMAPVQTCTSCGQHRAGGPGQAFVYAVGRLEPRFPTLAVEKEFAQALGRAGTPDLRDHGALRKVLSQAGNGYLLRQLCWVLSIQGTDAYIVIPAPGDEGRPLEALRSSPQPTDLDVVIGTAGPPMGGRACNGLMVPTVMLAQLYSFSLRDFVGHLPRPKGIAEDAFAAAVATSLRLTENGGARSDHRAVNYLVTRDPSLHGAVAEHAAARAPLTSVQVRSSGFSGMREIVDVILGFRHRETNVVEQLAARVDVSELFPFLVAPMSPHLER